MISVSASVSLPLHHKVQKFSSGTGSPGWSQKQGRKTVVVRDDGVARASAGPYANQHLIAEFLKVVCSEPNQQCRKALKATTNEELATESSFQSLCHFVKIDSRLCLIWNHQCTVLYLFGRRSVLICHHVLAVTNCLLLTLYGGPAAAVQ